MINPGDILSTIIATTVLLALIAMAFICLYLAIRPPLKEAWQDMKDDFNEWRNRKK